VAAPNIASTLNQVGNREDLTDVIHRVAPEKTPLISLIGRGKAKARQHDWQVEDLAAPNGNNAQLEGDDVGTLDNPNVSERLANYCQIFRKTGGVSRTQEQVDKAGRKSEMTRQKVLKGIELRRDKEARYCGNYGSKAEAAGPPAVPRESAGLLAWMETNTNRGAGGADGGFSNGIVSPATNGTLRTFTEAQVKAVQADRFAASGSTDGAVAMMGGALKQKFSEFTGIADIRKDVTRGMATIVAGAEVYVSDFGELRLVPHPYAFARDCAIIDPSMLSDALLDGYQTEPLAKTGDNERFMMIAESTLEMKNEKAHGVVADIKAA